VKDKRLETIAFKATWRRGFRRDGNGLDGAAVQMDARWNQTTERI
jgi:hypothetical protein